MRVFHYKESSPPTADELRDAPTQKPNDNEPPPGHSPDFPSRFNPSTLHDANMPANDQQPAQQSAPVADASRTSSEQPVRHTTLIPAICQAGCCRRYSPSPPLHALAFHLTTGVSNSLPLTAAFASYFVQEMLTVFCSVLLSPCPLNPCASEVAARKARYDWPVLDPHTWTCKLTSTRPFAAASALDSAALSAASAAAKLFGWH